ncbi:MAG: hypothetical protein ACYCPQ_06805 [Elusimicrobiota bacterium]
MEHETDSSPSQKPRSHGSGPLATAALLIFVASTVFALYYRYRQDLGVVSSTNLSGFDISQSPNQTRGQTPEPLTSEAPPQPRTGLGLIQGSLPQSPGRGSGNRPNAERQAAASITAACRANEGSVAALAMEYTRKYPVIAQYGRDWMSYPDLRALNFDYMRNHDPIAFIKGVSRSQNFRILVRKYARRPEIQAFAKDIVSRAPAGLTAAVSTYLASEKNDSMLVDMVAASLGLPAGVLNFNGQGSPQINAGSLIQSLLNNPSAQTQGQPNGTPALSP